MAGHSDHASGREKTPPLSTNLLRSSMAGDRDPARALPSRGRGRGRLDSQLNGRGKQDVADMSDCTAVAAFSRGRGGIDAVLPEVNPIGTKACRVSRGRVGTDAAGRFIDEGNQVVSDRPQPAGSMVVPQRISQPPAASSTSRTKPSSVGADAELPYMDKGKGVAKEQVARRPQPAGFMADARRTRQAQAASLTLSHVNRAREETDFTLKPVGSTVTKPFKLRAEVFRELFPYQVDGLEWLWNIHCRGTGGLLADDMGLGKTKQILAFLAGLLESKLVKTALVAVPAAIVHQWTTEMTNLGLGKYICIFKNKQTRKAEFATFCESGGILITTHTLATNNCSVLKAVPWDYMIIDEAHVTCHKETLKSYHNLQRLRCSHKILLTGTPAPNGLKELRAILNFCCPGLFSSASDFYDNYLAPLVEGNYKGSSSEQLNESSKASQKLQGLLRSCFLRRLKSVLTSTDTPEKQRLNLPEKAEFVVWLKLTPYQEKLYRGLLTGNIIQKNNPGEMIVVSTVLQKICNHPNKLEKTSLEELDGRQGVVLRRMVRQLRSITSRDGHISEGHESCKLAMIVRLLERFKEQQLRVLIFSRTCEMLDAIEEVIYKKGYAYDRIDGSLNDNERGNRTMAFKEDDGAPIFLISSFSGGTGLDLSMASRAIIVEPFWNPSVDDQCADRIYRVGQKNKCIIYRLISSETIEETVYKTQVFKQGIFKSATENKDFQRYITEKLKNELLETPQNGYGSSRTLQVLEKEPTPTLSEEMINELNFLRNEDVVGVSIHGALFQGAPSRKPIKSVDLVGSDERNWHVDEEEISRRAREQKIAFHEAEISRYTSRLAQHTRNSSLPDRGANLVKVIERNKEALAKLRAADPKDET